MHLVINSLIYSTDAKVLCLLLMLGMFIMVKIGHYLRLKSSREYESMGSIEGSSYGLLGLILAFTFGMSASRYDNRRAIVIDEVNNIAGAMLRVEGISNDSIRHAFYVDYRNLLDQRIKTNVTKVFDPQYDSARFASYKVVRKLIRHANDLGKIPEYNYAAYQMVAALIKVNESITSRFNSESSTVPDEIIILLIIFALSCSLFAGFSFPKDKKVNWLPVMSFILFTGVVIYVILDLDRPKRGFINLDIQYARIVDLKMMLPADLEK
ncbi:MAG: hypothetical protein WCP74_11275 [Sphingobacteriia bacterium]